MEDKSKSIKVALVSDSDTLGQYAGPDTFQSFKPSTQQLLQYLKSSQLRIGAVINLEAGDDHAQAVECLRSSILSEDAATGKCETIGDYIAASDVISNAQAGVAKPDCAIYRFAAGKLGVTAGECLFISENFHEILGAKRAGMETELKPCPVGMEFMPALVAKIGESPVDSGRQFQALFEHEHLLGDRIFESGAKISEWIDKLLAGWSPQLDLKRWQSPPAIKVPDELERAMACYIFLIDNFADQVHLRAEEAMLEVAAACGMPPERGQWVFDQHDQARAYWRGLDIAWKRIKQGDSDDRWFALRDFKALTDGFVYLFKAHAIREDYETYTEAGRHFADADDALVMNLIAHTGPSDITPYVGMVERMEAHLSHMPA